MTRILIVICGVAAIALAALWSTREVVVPLPSGYVILDRWSGHTTVCYTNPGRQLHSVVPSDYHQCSILHPTKPGDARQLWPWESSDRDNW